MPRHLSTLAGNNVTPVGPYVIILDLNMPDLDGQQILRLIKNPDHPENNWWKQIPVVLNSNMASEDIGQNCFDAGAVTLLTNSGEFNEIKGMLESNWLRQMQGQH